MGSLAKLSEPRKWDEWLASESPLQVVYRESPALLKAEPQGYVTNDNPAPLQRGMVTVKLDGSARLRSFDAMPLPDGGIKPVAPETLFAAAGLDPGQFIEQKPSITPRFATDRLRAWTGPHPKIPTATVKASVGWWKGRVTFARFDIEFPKPKAAAPAATTAGWFNEALPFILAAAAGIGLFFGIFLAIRNWKLSRGDRKGALRLAVAVMVLGALQWAGKVHPVADLDMFNLFFGSVQDWMLSAFSVALLYIALEPALRSRWPHSIVG